MATRKTSRSFALDRNTDIRVVIKQLNDHINNMTEDLCNLLDNGVSVEDNFNAVVKEVTFTSGKATEIGKLKSKSAAGAGILNTFGATVTGFSVDINGKGEAVMTLAVTPNPSKIKVIIYGK